ncbi:hypothetical protein Pst134EB_006008 [Puccinia striiformis f. sp. tritici]|nr:hypothetical protein Pst134EB_006008 [Puccinia striiformis f. sp. tritici]
MQYVRLSKKPVLPHPPALPVFSLFLLLPVHHQLPCTPPFVPASTPNSVGTPTTPAAPTTGSNPTTNLPPRPVTSILHSAPVTHHAPIPMPEFKTPEDAERAFIGLLRLKGVTPSWTWEQTMRDIITEPLYKARQAQARKAAWEKFIDSERKREKENREKISLGFVRESAGLDSLGEPKTTIDDQGAEVKLPGVPPKLWWTWDRLKLEVEKLSRRFGNYVKMTKSAKYYGTITPPNLDNVIQPPQINFEEGNRRS